MHLPYDRLISPVIYYTTLISGICFDPEINRCLTGIEMPGSDIDGDWIQF